MDLCTCLSVGVDALVVQGLRWFGVFLVVPRLVDAVPPPLHVQPEAHGEKPLRVTPGVVFVDCIQGDAADQGDKVTLVGRSPVWQGALLPSIPRALSACNRRFSICFSFSKAVVSCLS